MGVGWGGVAEVVRVLEKRGRMREKSTPLFTVLIGGEEGRKGEVLGVLSQSRMWFCWSGLGTITSVIEEEMEIDGTASEKTFFFFFLPAKEKSAFQPHRFRCKTGEQVPPPSCDAAE